MICGFHFTDQPEITAQPQNMTLAERKNVTLSCNATGNPAPSILWTKDGSAVNSPRINLSLDNKQLTITNVSRDDSGDYQCVANNSIGAAVTSNTATLDVQCKYSWFLRSISRLFGGGFAVKTVCTNVITRMGLLQESTMGLRG